MLRPEGLLIDRQRAFEERSGGFMVAALAERHSEVVEGLRGIGVVGAEALFASAERPLIKRARLGKGAEGSIDGRSRLACNRRPAASSTASGGVASSKASAA